jgi:hypothetical protein
MNQRDGYQRFLKLSRIAIPSRRPKRVPETSHQKNATPNVPFSPLAPAAFRSTPPPGADSSSTTRAAKKK